MLRLQAFVDMILQLIFPVLCDKLMYTTLFSNFQFFYSVLLLSFLRDFEIRGLKKKKKVENNSLTKACSLIKI